MLCSVALVVQAGEKGVRKRADDNGHKNGAVKRHMHGIQQQSREEKQRGEHVEQQRPAARKTREYEDAEIAGFVQHFVQEQGGQHHELRFAGGQAQREPKQGGEGIVHGIAGHERR